jgi:polar amino acid transport system substrate-binding protein
MRQVTQRLKDGRIEILEVPEPVVAPTEVLVDVRASVISVGTERAKVVTGKKTLVGKARSRPDQVQQVLEKARRDGVRATLDAVRLRLDAPAALGYSAAGVVLQVGARVKGIAPGDRVACAGADYAVHAEVVRVPSNLCVPIPDGVSFDHAAFATIGAIALHGVRQTDGKLGERVAVIGMGLVGQLAGQLLRAAGCVVIGVDLSSELLELARSSGAADRTYVRDELRGKLPEDARECDSVLITAASPTNDPVQLAALLSRDRGRVVVLGDVNLDVPRAAFYEKELDLRLSRSYGPGRYDREYEERGLDYPIGYVRWTERRNLQAFVDVVAARRVDVEPLITSRIPLADAPEAYERLAFEKTTPLGIVLTYDTHVRQTSRVATAKHNVAAPRAGLIGSGSYAQRILVPALRSAGFELAAVASAAGLSAQNAADKFGFGRAVTPDELLVSADVDVVVIATQHSTHAELAVRALESGRSVFVEKPPAIAELDLDRIAAAARASGGHVAVGFNRRFAPLAQEFRDHLRDTRAPIDLLFRVNAGELPQDHWLNDLDAGGGRLIGEGCHFVDFVCWVVGDLPTNITAAAGRRANEPAAAAQSFAITLGFVGGSIATILYGSGGAAAVGKEYVEGHAGGRSAVLDDFRSLELFDGRRRRRVRRRTVDKGNAAQMTHFRDVLAGAAEEIAPDPLETMRLTFAALHAIEGYGQHD